MFYKIIKNNTVIDVNNVFLHENPKNHILTETTYEHVHFIVSSKILRLNLSSVSTDILDISIIPLYLLI